MKSAFESVFNRFVTAIVAPSPHQAVPLTIQFVPLSSRRSSLFVAAAPRNSVLRFTASLKPK